MELLHQNSTPSARDFVRTYVWLLWLGSLLLLPLAAVGRLPFVSHNAAGPFAKLPISIQELLLTPGALLFVQVIAAGSVIAALLKPTKIAFSVLACFTITLIQCQLRGFGHVNHAEIILLLAVYTLTYFDFVRMMENEASEVNRSNGAEGPRKKLSHGAPIIAIATILCLSYSLTGVCRLGDGGFAVFTSSSLTAWQEVATLTPRYFDLGFGDQLMQSRMFAWMFEAGYPFITLVEILAPLCLVSVWVRRVFFATMIPFHILTVLLMGILFWENLALYVVLIDLGKWLPEKDTKSRSWFQKLSQAIVSRRFTSSPASQ